MGRVSWCCARRALPLAGEARKEVQYKHSINCTIVTLANAFAQCLMSEREPPPSCSFRIKRGVYAPDKFQPVIELNSCLVLSRREAINALPRPTPDTRIPHRFFLPRISCASNLVYIYVYLSAYKCPGNFQGPID